MLILSGSWISPARGKGTAALLLLVPGGLSDPVEGEACICSDLDGSCFCLSDCLLDRLHQVLSVVDQHLSSLSKREFSVEITEPSIYLWAAMHWEIRTHLLWLLFTDVGTTQHGGLDRGQNFELSADGGNTLTHLKESQEAKLKQRIMTKKKENIPFSI